MDDFEACIAHLRFPVTHRRAIRTTNLLERLFAKERRRLKIIPNAFGERALEADIRCAHPRRRTMEVDQGHQVRAAPALGVKKELDQEYEVSSRSQSQAFKARSPNQNIRQFSDLTRHMLRKERNPAARLARQRQQKFTASRRQSLALDRIYWDLAAAYKATIRSATTRQSNFKA